MQDTTIQLIKEKVVPDSVGNQIVVRTVKTVYATVLPITQNEFFQARTIGINPRAKFEIVWSEYDEEKLLQWKGTTYSIYRVYEREDEMIELYAQRKLGGSSETGVEEHGSL